MIITSISGPLIEKNLLGYIKTNQTAELVRAKTQLSFAGNVPDFVEVYNSSQGRVRDRFPNLMLVQRVTKFDETSENYSLHVVHTFGFEMEIADADADILTEKVNVYGTALMNMLWNCPAGTLRGGVASLGHPTVSVTDFDRDQTRGNVGAFLQTPRVVCTVELNESTPPN